MLTFKRANKQINNNNNNNNKNKKNITNEQQ